MTRIPNRSLFAAALLITLLHVQGCGILNKKPVRLEKTENRPNTFRMVVPKSLIPLGEKNLITGVSVFELDPNEREGSKVYWRLIAPKPVSAKGFELVIGAVPEGFDQMIPPAREVFTPVPGKEYYIAVAVKKGSATKWETIKWVAEKPFF